MALFKRRRGVGELRPTGRYCDAKFVSQWFDLRCVVEGAGSRRPSKEITFQV